MQVIGPDAMRWILGLSFLAMAVWALIPDDAPDETIGPPRYGVFLATAVAFFLVEMGDKTQIATVALAAQFQTLVPVVIGTTLGMLIANVPVVFAGDAVVKRVPLKTIRIVAALTFVRRAGAVLPLLTRLQTGRTERRRSAPRGPARSMTIARVCSALAMSPDSSKASIAT